MAQEPEVTVHARQASPEHTLGMGEIAKVVQRLTGYRPSRATLWRWHLTGRLETRRIGGRIYATESAVRRMLERDEQANRGSVNQRSQAAAERVAVALGASRRKRGES
jgi:hypothetical protein